jgi:hypothetical protein
MGVVLAYDALGTSVEDIVDKAKKAASMISVTGNPS